MRSLPSQGPFHIKTRSSSSFSPTLTLSPSTSLLPRDRPAPHHSHIRAFAVSLSPHEHTKRLLSVPLCLIVNEKANLPALISLVVYTALFPVCIYIYIYLCLCKNVLACLKIAFWLKSLPWYEDFFIIWEGHNSESVLLCVLCNRDLHGSLKTYQTLKYRLIF